MRCYSLCGAPSLCKGVELFLLSEEMEWYGRLETTSKEGILNLEVTRSNVNDSSLSGRHYLQLGEPG